MAEEYVIPVLEGEGNFTVYTLLDGQILHSGQMGPYGDISMQVTDANSQGVVGRRIDVAALEQEQGQSLPPNISYAMLFRVDVGDPGLAFIAIDPDSDMEVFGYYKDSLSKDLTTAWRLARKKLISSAYGSPFCYWLIDDDEYPLFYNVGYNLDRIKNGLAWAALDSACEVEFLAKPHDDPTSQFGEFQKFTQAQCAVFARDMWAWYYAIDNYYYEFLNEVSTAPTMADLIDLANSWSPPETPTIPPAYVDP